MLTRWFPSTGSTPRNGPVDVGRAPLAATLSELVRGDREYCGSRVLPLVRLGKLSVDGGRHVSACRALTMQHVVSAVDGVCATTLRCYRCSGGSVVHTQLC